MLLPGGEYAEDHERRQRTRYAIVSALAESGYHLKFNNRMSYVEETIPVRQLWGWQRVNFVLPIKLYRHDDESRAQILVIWIDESQLGLRPLLALHRITHKLFYGLCEADQKLFSMSVIGPNSSGTLKWMVEEFKDLKSVAGLLSGTLDGTKEEDGLARHEHWFVSDYCLPARKQDECKDKKCKDKNCKDKKCKKMQAEKKDKKDKCKAGYGQEGEARLEEMCGFRPFFQKFADPKSALDLLSPRATVDKLCKHDEGCNCLESDEIKLRRVIGSDLKLAKKLKKEIASRGALRGNVVLITEHDTEYGRAAIETFDRLFDTEPNVELRVFRFLRGIDGMLPGDKRESVAAQKPRSDVTSRHYSYTAEDVVSTRRPEGKSQYDYLRRLRRELSELNEIQAIGVVGSDVYDKLLVLRALKPYFPNCVFFTTDLDEIFVHEDELSHTRNLIVASHFVLRLATELQKETPPFRDAYQTATFLATRFAVRNVESAEERKLFQSKGEKKQKTLLEKAWQRIDEGKGLPVTIGVVGRASFRQIGGATRFHPKAAKDNSVWHFFFGAGCLIGLLSSI